MINKLRIIPALQRGFKSLNPGGFEQTLCVNAGIILLSSCLILCPPAAAARRYQSPSGDPPSGSFGSNGTRGCSAQSSLSNQIENQEQIPLTLLAPLAHVGRTTTTSPTLAWFIPHSEAYRVQVSLFAVNPDQSTELIHELEYVEASSGMIHYTPPSDKSGLQFGQRYQVQLSLACTPNSGSFDQFFVAEIDVQEPTASLTQSIAKSQSYVEKATLFAEAGFWFDAVSVILTEMHKSQGIPQMQTLLKELAVIEEGEHRDALSRISAALNSTDLFTPVHQVNTAVSESLSSQ